MDEEIALMEESNKDTIEPTYLDDGFASVEPWLQKCEEVWNKSWTPGTYLVPDETMIFWTGVSGGHLTYIPRKPTSLGFLLKTVVCGSSGILLRAEISGRKEDMA